MHVSNALSLGSSKWNMFCKCENPPSGSPPRLPHPLRSRHRSTWNRRRRPFPLWGLYLRREMKISMDSKWPWRNPDYLKIANHHQSPQSGAICLIISYIYIYTWEGGDESQPPKQCSWFFLSNTQRLLHTDPFTHKHLYTERLYTQS